ncbi:MAG: tRNA-dihydrouridine synthase, partial [Luminiphilus sp.]
KLWELIADKKNWRIVQLPNGYYQAEYNKDEAWIDVTRRETLDACEAHLEHVDGVMLGRAPYQNPWLLSDVDTRLFGAGDAVSTDREAAIDAMLPYIEQQLADGARLHHVTRHMLGLYQGQYGGRQYRRHLSEHAHKAESDEKILLEAMAFAATPPERAAAAG